MHLTKEPINSKYIKKLNRMTVINTIKKHEPVSRQQLAEFTGLTPPAISGIVRELLEAGLVREVGLDKSSGGRRPVNLCLNPEAGYVIGIEVTRFESLIGIADLKNDPTDFRIAKIDMTDPKKGIKLLADAVEQIMSEEKYLKKAFLGIGVAFPGLLNVREGSVKRSINLGKAWDSFNVKEFLESELELPIFIENNSNTSVLAERWFGGGKGCKDLVYINLGEGISAGIILNDRILQGARGYAGEIGHMSIQEGGPLCNCGNRGCLESICGIPAIIRQAKAELPNIAESDPLKKAWLENGEISIADIIESANIPDSYSWKLLRQMSIYIGKAIANVINFYNPELIFIGGKMSVIGDYFMDIIRKTANIHAFPEIALSTEIKVSELKEKSGVVGACALALKHLFKTDSDMLEDVRQIMNA